MSKRKLTKEEIEMAATIKAAIEKGDKSQEAIGLEVGVEQGAIWQWMNAKTPVSAKRAKAFARAIGISDPATISLAYKELHTSQSARLDVNKLAELIEAVTAAVAQSKKIAATSKSRVSARWVASLYEQGVAASSVQSILASLLNSMEEA